MNWKKKVRREYDAIRTPKTTRERRRSTAAYWVATAAMLAVVVGIGFAGVNSGFFRNTVNSLSELIYPPATPDVIAEWVPTATPSHNEGSTATPTPDGGAAAVPDWEGSEYYDYTNYFLFSGQIHGDIEARMKEDGSVFAQHIGKFPISKQHREIAEFGDYSLDFWYTSEDGWNRVIWVGEGSNGWSPLDTKGEDFFYITDFADFLWRYDLRSHDLTGVAKSGKLSPNQYFYAVSNEEGITFIDLGTTKRSNIVRNSWQLPFDGFDWADDKTLIVWNGGEYWKITVDGETQIIDYGDVKGYLGGGYALVGTEGRYKYELRNSDGRTYAPGMPNFEKHVTGDNEFSLSPGGRYITAAEDWRLSVYDIKRDEWILEDAHSLGAPQWIADDTLMVYLTSGVDSRGVWRFK
ncbi:hypothetical protein FACS18949_11010 [Clostridia bacterium]|nr:hypothetical protein FACS18949_11010 [Clostridia bacterium]